jgi:hypothetical protein
MPRGITVEEIMRTGTLVSGPDALILPTEKTLYVVRNTPAQIFLAIVELVDCDYSAGCLGSCFVKIFEIIENIGKGGELPFEVRVGEEINTPLGDLYLM